MPRKPTVRSNSHFYHVTARSNNRENFCLPLVEVWGVFLNQLRVLQTEFQIQIGAFVLMDNHFHLLMLTPKEDIDRVMYFLMKKVTLQIQKRSGRINKIFGGRYKGCLIENERYLMNVYKYIYRNPLVVGKVERAEAYEFSTLNVSHNLQIKTVDLFYGSENLSWINESYALNESQSLAKGLKKTVFSYTRDHSTGRIIEPSLPFH